MIDASQRLVAPRGLALAFTLVVVSFCCRVDNSLLMMLDMQGVMLPFLAALGAGALGGCVAIACAPRSRRSRVALSVAGTAGCVAGLTVAGFVQALPLFGCALSSGALLGFGLACMLSQWWSMYATMTSDTLLATSCAAFFVAALLWYVLRHVGSFPVTCFCLVVCALCGGLLYLLALFSSKGDAEGDADGAVSDDRAGVAVTSRRLARSRKLAIAAGIGMLFNFFTLGLTFWPAAAGVSTSAIGLKPLSYAVIAVALVFVARHAAPGKSAAAAFSTVALPIAAAIVLASPFLEIIVDLGELPFSSAATYLGVALFNVLGFALPLCAIRDGGRSSARTAAVYLVGCMLALVAGMVVFRLLGQGAQVVSLCIMAAYLAGLVIASMRGAGERTARSSSAREPHAEDDVGAAESPDKRAAACGHVAAQYALSPRESEILRYLARGHGAKYIAERLFISADTVRTHCKRIYEKTGVHAKDELLELVERAE